MNSRPMNITVRPSAQISGLMVGLGIGMWSSFAVLPVAGSTCTPCAAAALWRGVVRSQSGTRDVTRGMRAKLYSGGGDGIDHSSVAASQGLFPAIAPFFMLRKKL